MLKFKDIDFLAIDMDVVNDIEDVSIDDDWYYYENLEIVSDE